MIEVIGFVLSEPHKALERFRVFSNMHLKIKIIQNYFQKYLYGLSKYNEKFQSE